MTTGRGHTAAGDAPTADVTVGIGPDGAPAPRRLGTFLRPGELFGPWKLLDHIADGGFGSVWRAAAAAPVRTDQRTVRIDENAAIKFFAATTTEHRRGIEREVTLARRLGGQWTPEFFGADLDAIPQWAAFELITDATLRDLVRSTGPLSGQSLEVFAEDLWDALAFFRRHGVAHRDLTPVNIHVNARTAKPRVIDWGNAGDACGAVHTAQLPRSAGFAAPEQVEGRATGSAADLWSWAAVVCFAASGHPPLPLDGYHERIITCDQPLDLDGVPGNLLPALDAALRWDPDDRDPERIADLLPGRRTSVDLEAARARESDLDEILTDLHRRMRLRDEHLDELRGLVEAHEHERRHMIDVARDLAATEAARDDAAREVTSLRSRVAELENELRRTRSASSVGRSDRIIASQIRDAQIRDAQIRDAGARDAALRQARVATAALAISNRHLRWRRMRLQRKLERHRRRHGQIPTPAPLVAGGLVTVAITVAALAGATWESRLLPVLFALPALLGLLVVRRVTARSPRWTDHVRAAATAAAILIPFLAPLAFSAGAFPSRGLATWVMQAPFVTPPPAERIGVGHGARASQIDASDCTTPLSPNSYWDIRIVPCDR